MTERQCEAISLARWAFYDFFSKLFYEPEADMLEASYGRLLAEANQRYPVVRQEVVDNFSRVITETEAIQALLIEYSKLYVGPSQLVAPPYGSYYLDGGQVMGDSTMEVKAYYRRAGFKVMDQIKEPPDHVAIVMNFLAQLAEKEHQLIESGAHERAKQILQMAAEFYLRYPAQWLEEFAENTRKGTHHRFYALGAEILIGFNQQESRYYQGVLFGDGT